MKTVVAIIVFWAFAFTLSAQVPIKKDLMEMYEKIPPPPATVKEAFTKVTTNSDYTGSTCSAEKIFSTIDKETKDIEAEFAAQPKPTLETAAPGYSAENAKKMNDPEMKKKMKTMTKEEKMKMAMEMMKSAPAATQMDPPPIRAAVDAWQIIYNDTQNEFQRSVKEQQEEVARVHAYENSHAKIDSAMEVEISKLPQISSGEMSAPDPAELKKVKLKAADKHIALADNRLEQIRQLWQQSLDHGKERYSLFYKKLALANYAEDSKNFSTKKILADAQLTILQNVVRLIEQSRQAWEESASWQARRVAIEKE